MHYARLKRNGHLYSVRNTGPAEQRFFNSFLKGSPEQCWEWKEYRNRKGYGKLCMPGGKSVRAHRFSWEHHNGPIPNGAMVLHRCDNRCCVNPAHLFLGDAAVNARDKVSKGRHHTKPGVVLYKLTPPMVLNIRVMYARGISVEKLAWIYSADTETIRSIVKGRARLRW